MVCMKKSLSQNKKILNATKTVYNGIEFKSITEKRIYKALIELGITPKYENKTFKIWKGCYPTVRYYTKNNRNNLMQDQMKLRDIHYTPDFTFYYRGYFVIIEVKGFENDVFPMKFKIFRKYLEGKRNKRKIILAEIFNKRMLLQFIDELNKLESNEEF